MKAIERRKSGFTNAAIKASLADLEDTPLTVRKISGEDFCAIELTYKTHRVSAVSVTHWRDRHNYKKGERIAMGRARLKMALLFLELDEKEAKVILDEKLVEYNKERQLVRAQAFSGPVAEIEAS